LVHHDLPHVPWFALKRVYEAHRQQYIERSGFFLIAGYGKWMTQHMFSAVAHPAHGEAIVGDIRLFPARTRVMMQLIQPSASHDFE
jgi:hypothetical protein